MFIASITRFFHQDLDNLIKELQSYTNEEDIWRIAGDIKNSAGILAVHLVGNLNHFIGEGIGKNGYQRNRPLEFSIEFVPREELVEMLQATKIMIAEALDKMEESQLGEPSPFPFTRSTVDTTLDYLIHLQSHLNWHLGQVNYHRRLINSTS